MNIPIGVFRVFSYVKTFRARTDKEGTVLEMRDMSDRLFPALSWSGLPPCSAALQVDIASILAEDCDGRAICRHPLNPGPPKP